MAKYCLIIGSDTFVEDDDDTRSEYESYEDAVEDAKKHALTHFDVEIFVAKIVGVVKSERPPAPGPLVVTKKFED